MSLRAAEAFSKSNRWLNIGCFCPTEGGCRKKTSDLVISGKIARDAAPSGLGCAETVSAVGMKS